MKYRVLIITTLLMFLIIVGLIFVKTSNSLFIIKDEFVTYIEENYQVKLKVQKASFWPLNQFSLEGVEIASLDNRLLLSVPEINIQYRLFKVLEGNSDLRKVIEYVKLENPQLKVIDPEEPGNFGDLGSGEQDIKEIVNNLFSATPFQLIINNGTIHYLDYERDLHLNNLSFTYQKINQTEGRIVITTNIGIDKFKWNNGFIQGLHFDNLEIGLVYLGNDWQASLITDYFRLEEVFTLTRHLENLPIEIETPEGMGKINMTLSGRGLAINKYSGSLYLENGSAVINTDSYLETGQISQLKGEIEFNSGDNILFLKDCTFAFQQTPFSFDGSLRFTKEASPQIIGRLISDKFSPSLFIEQFGDKDLKGYSDLIGLEGRGFLDLTIAGTLSEPGVSLEFYQTDGLLAGKKLDNLQLIIRHHHDYIYLDTLNLLIDGEGLISAQGLYNTSTIEYSLDLSCDNLNTSLLQEVIGKKPFIDKDNDFINQVDGRINLISSITGRGFDLNNLNMYGQLEVLSTSVKGFEIGRFESSFWLADNRVLLQKGKIDNGKEQLSFSGEVGIKDQIIQLELGGSQLELASLRNRFQLLTNDDLLNKLSGEISIKGTITQSIQDPLVNLKVEMPTGEILGYQVSDLQFKANYGGDRLEISELKLTHQQATLTGEGVIDVTGQGPYLNAKINGNTGYTLLTELTGYQIPLEGELRTEIHIEGPFKKPVIQGNIDSQNTVLKIDNRSVSVDDLQLSFYRNEKDFLIESLEVGIGSSRLQVIGKLVEESLDLKLVLNEFDLQNIPLKEDISGKFSFIGNIKGSISKPELEGSFTAGNIGYRDILMDNIEGQVVYAEGDLLLNKLKCYNNEFSYSIDGKISDLPNEMDFSLVVKTEKGKISHFFNPLETSLPIPEDYIFKGILELGGNRVEPSAQVDLVFLGLNETEKMELKGKVGQELKLTMKGQGVEVGKLPFIQKQNLDIRGILNFRGEISGQLNSYDLILETELAETTVNKYTVKGASGTISIDKSAVIEIEQQLLFSEDKKIEINGSIPLEKNGTGFNLKMRMNGFPLQLLSSYASSVPVMEGFLVGELFLSGDINSPALNGDIYLVNGKMDLKLPDLFTNLRGQLVFSGQEVSLSDLKGQYGDGDIIIKGKVYPFSSENLALNASGNDLPFNHGSFNGRFDTQIEISGSFEKPLVQATAVTHDLIIGLPIRWPRTKREINDFDITLYPGEEVYVMNDNIKVLVQEGSLNIINQGNQVEFEGLLKSEQGSFDYYNNKFIVSEASATFNKYSGFIPDLNVKASTRIKGAIIEVNINGQANNMITTFNSSPPLTEKEILTLLTSKGGLGEFMTGNYENIITKEILRLLYNYLQADVVEDIQNTFKDVFSLDRFELDTYNLGWEKELVVYLGKYINKRLYLQYSSTITPDLQDNELALRYYITDNLHFESSWQGEDNYSLSLKTNLDF